MVWFPFADSICFCDAGFHFMITSPEKASWHNARESAKSGGTIYLDRHRMDTLVTIR